MPLPRSLPFGSLAAWMLAMPASAQATSWTRTRRNGSRPCGPIMLPTRRSASTRTSRRRRPRRVPEDLLGAARPRPGDARERVPGRVREGARPRPTSATRSPAGAGSHTDCGRVFILLGKPDEVQEGAGGAARAARPGDLDLPRPARHGRSRAARPQIAFDEECRAAGRARARSSTASPRSAWCSRTSSTRSKDGRLVKLADLLPKDSAAARAAEAAAPGLPGRAAAVLPEVADGGTALSASSRGDAAGLTVDDAGGKSSVALAVAASAVDEDGKEAASGPEQVATAPVEADGSFVAGFKLALRPGKYTLKAGAGGREGRQGIARSDAGRGAGPSKVESGGDGTASKLASAGSLISCAASRSCRAARRTRSIRWRAFELGPLRLVPRFGGVAKVSRPGRVLLPGLRPEARRRHGQGRRQRRRQRPQGRQDARRQGAAEQRSRRSSRARRWARSRSPLRAGKYIVQLKVTDKLGKQEVVQEAPFEVNAVACEQGLTSSSASRATPASPKADVLRVLDAALAQVTRALRRGDEVKLVDFGTFPGHPAARARRAQPAHGRAR